MQWGPETIRDNVSHRTENIVPVVQQKAINGIPPIALYNEKPIKTTNRKDHDAPQFEMNVLNSKRKRTMGELGYNELISPAQIESPSEKLVRMAKKHRKLQERCDPLLQSTNAGDVQSATEIDHAYGPKKEKINGENVESALTPIVHESHARRETAARLGDERGEPSVVGKRSSVSPYSSTEGHRNPPKTQRSENHSDGHMNAQEIHSTQSSAQGHDDSINDAYSSGSASRKPKDQKSRARIAGPTNICGVFSPETKPPVKRSNHGAFHCPRCDSQFTKSLGVNYHFESCVAKYGNPKSLKWSDHPSLEGVAKRAFPASKDTRAMRAGSPVSAASEGTTQSNVPIDGQTALGSMRVESRSTLMHVPADNQTEIAAPIAHMRAPLLGSDTLGSNNPCNMPTHRPVTKDHVSPKLDSPLSPVEHGATAGKGLSHETLKRFQETGSWNRSMVVDQNEAGAEEEEIETPKIAYHYYVQKREWLETEEDAIELSLGPFHTMDEANAVAKVEVQCPQIDKYEGFQSTGWSYYYEQDENGLQKHMATVLDIHIETAVDRGKCDFFRLVSRRTKLSCDISELAPAKERVFIPKSAFIVAPRVYIVHELQWLPTPGNDTITGPTHCQSLTHGVFTLIKKANQRASTEYLDTLTGNWGNSEYDLLKKEEMKSDLDRKVRDLNRENDCFREEIKLDSDGFVKVWVEAVVVEGPRN